MPALCAHGKPLDTCMPCYNHGQSPARTKVFTDSDLDYVRKKMKNGFNNPVSGEELERLVGRLDAAEEACEAASAGLPRDIEGNTPAQTTFRKLLAWRKVRGKL